MLALSSPSSCLKMARLSFQAMAVAAFFFIVLARARKVQDGAIEPTGVVPAPPSDDFAALLLESGFQANAPVEVDPPFKYPFVVNIALYDFPICMGTLISPKVVITAAQCDYSSASLYVWIGRHNLDNSSEWNKDLQSFKVIDKAFPETPYSATDNHSNDIMLLKLDREVDVEKFPPIAIDDGSLASAMERSEIEAVNVGHGTVGQESSMGDEIKHMYQVNMRGVPMSLCNSPDVYGGKVTDTMMCASNLDIDLCRGSSGAPLMVFSSTEHPVMVGMTSWAISCDTAVYPTVYTRVGAYNGWIAKLLAEDEWESQEMKAPGASQTLNGLKVDASKLLSCSFDCRNCALCDHADCSELFLTGIEGALEPSAPPPSNDFAALLLDSGFQANAPVEVDPPFKYPFVVNIAKFNHVPDCMGTLISPTVVIAAAQCDHAFLNVWIGRHNLDNSSEWNKDLQSFKVIDKAFPETPYSAIDFSNDIMLLKLDREVDVEKFPPIAIDDGSLASAMERSEIEAVNVGHGALQSSARIVDIMHQVNMRGVPMSLCNSPDVYGGKVTDTMMCASNLDIDLCGGSSGAPLMVFSSTGHPVLVGMTSWGHTCYTAVYPAVYTRVGAYSSWIAKLLAEDEWGSQKMKAPGALEPSAPSPSNDLFAPLLLKSGFKANAPVEVDPPFKYPFVVNIARFNLMPDCMGTLISPTVVIAAAHCDHKGVPLYVWIGRHNLDNSSEWNKDLQSFKVIDKAFPETPYSATSDNHSNDIMLLKLDREVDVEKFPPIVIDDGSFASAMERSEIEAVNVGHGSVGQDINMGDKIRHMYQVNMRGVPMSLCNSPDVYGGKVTDTMMCASNLDIDLCGGSGGAPLLVYLPGGYSIMVGMTSWAISCDTAVYPTVYTRVGAYSGWVAEVLTTWGSQPAQIWPPTATIVAGR